MRVPIDVSTAVAVTLFAGDQPVMWRHVAKDGATLPAHQAVMRPARIVFGPGEIYDVEFTPAGVGELALRFGFPPPPPDAPPPAVPIPPPGLVQVRVQ